MSRIGRLDPFGRKNYLNLVWYNFVRVYRNVTKTYGCLKLKKNKIK